MPEDIKIEVKPDGTMIIETSGYKGAACEKRIDEIMRDAESRGFKVEVKDKKKKMEYYQNGTGTGILSKGK